VTLTLMMILSVGGLYGWQRWQQQQRLWQTAVQGARRPLPLGTQAPSLFILADAKHAVPVVGVGVIAQDRSGAGFPGFPAR
jgi:hypothetical protein